MKSAGYPVCLTTTSINFDSISSLPETTGKVDAVGCGDDSVTISSDLSGIGAAGATETSPVVILCM